MGIHSIFHFKRAVFQRGRPRGLDRFHDPGKRDHDFDFNPPPTLISDPPDFGSDVPKVFHRGITQHGLGDNARWGDVSVEVERYGV